MMQRVLTVILGVGCLLVFAAMVFFLYQIFIQDTTVEIEPSFKLFSSSQFLNETSFIQSFKNSSFYDLESEEFQTQTLDSCFAFTYKPDSFISSDQVKSYYYTSTKGMAKMVDIKCNYTINEIANMASGDNRLLDEVLTNGGDSQNKVINLNIPDLDEQSRFSIRVNDLTKLKNLDQDRYIMSGNLIVSVENQNRYWQIPIHSFTDSKIFPEKGKDYWQKNQNIYGFKLCQDKLCIL